MATISRNFGSDTDVYGASGGYVDVDNTETNSSDIDLETNGLVGVQITIDIQFADATPTEDVTCKIYGSLDGTNYDDVPISEFVIEAPASTANKQRSITMYGYAHLRFSLSKSADTEPTNAWGHYQGWSYTT